MARTKAGVEVQKQIYYVPTQVDPLAIASKRALRQSPLRLFLQDAGTLVKSLPYLPWLFLPYHTRDGQGELYPSARHTKETILQILLLILQAIFLIVLLPAMIVLPGLGFLLLVCIEVLLVKLIVLPMEGPRIVYSEVDDTSKSTVSQHKGERWVFINGCACGQGNFQGDVNRLAQVFGRQVMGIHNQTYGLLADILECLVQRVFAYTTTDVRVAYEQIKVIICDPWVSKVILIGHSQGGIIISLVLDELFSELPASIMSKLEVYTFGSAASHFSNPPMSTVAVPEKDEHFTISKGLKRSRYVISHVEHYANEYDMVPRWGVLHSTQTMLSTRYFGAVFLNMATSGHMFAQHYLDAMFPYLEPERQRLGKKNQLMEPFLDRVVNVDEVTVARRETVAAEELEQLKSKGMLDFGNGERRGYGSKDGSVVMTFSRTPTGRLVADEAKGKTVRQLSRLWQYQNGRIPNDDVVETQRADESP